MSTAIVPIYTDEGWVIGSDGLCTPSDGGTPNEKEQKIFEVKSAHGHHLAYALTGHTSFTIRATSAAVDLRGLLWQSSREIEPNDSGSANAWARHLCQRAHLALRQAKDADTLEDHFPEDSSDGGKGWLIAKVLVFGFYRDQQTGDHVPRRVEVRFFHESQRLGPLDVVPLASIPDGWATMGLGSRAVYTKHSGTGIGAFLPSGWME